MGNGGKIGIYSKKKHYYPIEQLNYHSNYTNILYSNIYTHPHPHTYAPTPYPHAYTAKFTRQP